MSIVIRARRDPGAERTAHWLTAALLATGLLVLAVVPVLAADPGASQGPISAEASASGSPDPSADPSASPDPSPSPSPSESPAPTPTPPPAPAYPTTVTTLGDTIRFYGRGYGHGVGLNQWGAKGRAAAGQTAEEILAAYFTGSVPGTVSPTRKVRVRLLTGYRAPSSAPLVIHGRGGAWSLSATDQQFPADAMLRVWRTTKTINGVATTVWKAKVVAADGTRLYRAAVTGTPVVYPVEPGAFLQLDSKPSRYDTYRGTLTLLLKSRTVAVVNRLGLDDYLRGTVPVEMPPNWPTEAVRAQAIAARSYAVKHLHPKTGKFDVYDDTRSQVYRGIEAETATTDAIIAADPGVVLRYAGKVVNAFFFSTGGGATESNEYAFTSSSGRIGTPVAYLRGISDRAADGTPYDADAPLYQWSTSTLTRQQLSAMFGADSRTSVGDLQRLDLRKRGVSGRLYKVVLYGSLGTKTVSADVFRSVYNARRPSGTASLRSNLFSPFPLP